MRNLAQTLFITIAAILASVLVFSAFMYLHDNVAPFELYAQYVRRLLR